MLNLSGSLKVLAARALLLIRFVKFGILFSTCYTSTVRYLVRII